MHLLYRFACVLGLIIFIIFIQGFSKTTRDEDQVIQKSAAFETNASEYLSEIRLLRDEIAFLRDAAGATEVGDSDADTGTSAVPPRYKGDSSKGLKTLPSKNGFVYKALPHLLDSEDALIPALTVGKQREGVVIVLGIPTVKRSKQSYLLQTLQSLLNSMSPPEKNDTLIIVFVAESADASFVQSTISSITRQFPQDVESGLIEIVTPPGSFYPDFKSIKTTMGDSKVRTKWRTKQNLDYVYLMIYAQSRGTYYVQLDDDILSENGFISTMKNFTIENSHKADEWFMLDFCQLGSIGKLFKDSDLWQIVEFILLFYQDKPHDWLLYHFINVKYCSLDAQGQCHSEQEKRWIHKKPSVFQHVGVVSSLKGKVQNYKDPEFGKVELFKGHENPEARVESTIKHFQGFSLDEAYHGRNFFWGQPPVAGDTIAFYFPKPIVLKCYRFVSGNVEHPSDKLYNASLEVLKVLPANPHSSSDVPKTNEFSEIDKFDEQGLVDAKVPPHLNPISAVRIKIKSALENGVILSEIYLEKE